MTENYAWFSDAMRDMNLAIAMYNDLRDIANSRDRSYGHESTKGVVLGKEYFPKNFWWKKSRRKNKKLTPFWSANDYWGVNGTAAEIMRRYDLGRCSLYPVEVLDRKDGEPVGGEYFCLNFGNVKSAFVPEASPATKRSVHDETKWRVISETSDWDIGVSKAALDGPDIWVDPILPRHFFLGKALGDEIVKAKLNKSFSLRKAAVVES